MKKQRAFLCCYLVTKLRLTLCNPKDCSLPGSSVRGISQATILEWVDISFSRDLPDPGIEPAGRFFYHWATWEVQKAFRIAKMLLKTKNKEDSFAPPNKDLLKAKVMKSVVSAHG